MPNPSNVVRKTAENVIRLGTPPTFAKSIYIDEIRKRAAEIKTAGESDAQAFTKAITADPIGIVLYKASKQADGPEVVQDAVEDFVGPPPSAGPAHDTMQRLADAHHRANPTKSPAQAYASVYSDPANADLRRRVVSEHLAPRLAQDAQEHQDRTATRTTREHARQMGGAVHGGPSDAESPDAVDKRSQFAKRDDSASVETLPNGTRVLTLEATRLAKASGERYDRARLRA